MDRNIPKMSTYVRKSLNVLINTILSIMPFSIELKFFIVSGTLFQLFPCVMLVVNEHNLSNQIYNSLHLSFSVIGD